MNIRNTKQRIEPARAPYLWLLLASAFIACSNPRVVPPAQYAAQLVGTWQGVVEGEREKVAFRSDGTFSAAVRRTGFISNTLSQGTTGTIRGDWSVAGDRITMAITSATKEHVRNQSETSVIESFQQGRLVVRSANGVTATFERVLSL